jgi:hypothetical protein
MYGGAGGTPPAFVICLLILIAFPELVLFLPNLIIQRG